MRKGDGGQAFPGSRSMGMSLRAYIAAQMLPGMIGMDLKGIASPKIADFAMVAVKYADALIAELAKEE